MKSLNELNRVDLIKILSLLNTTFEEKKSYLSSLDTEIGDGDHGFSMAFGFNNISAKLVEYSDKPIGNILKKAGLELINSIGGAAGAIFGTLFLGQASYFDDHLNGKDSLNLSDLCLMLNEALIQIKKRGNAQAGDKTMLDALEPAVLALCSVSKNGFSLSQGFMEATLAAKAGAENTKDMEGKRGRSKNLGKRSIGYIDPGSMSTYCIFETISRYIDNPE
jgi:dihydroxyacetone kinase-like protein